MMLKIVGFHKVGHAWRALALVDAPGLTRAQAESALRARVLDPKVAIRASQRAWLADLQRELEGLCEDFPCLAS